jgi:hypothetical protein
MDARLLAVGFLAVTVPTFSAWAEPSALRDLCPDRPGKGTSACTVDQGHFQLEIDAFDATLQRHDGMTTDTYFIANPTLKYGVLDNLDVEVNLVPYVEVRSRDRQSGVAQSVSGLGDLFLRAKYVPAIEDSHGISVGLEPFLKIPTAARAIGNGAVEGGLLVPLGLDLGSGWSLSSTPELDALQNQNNGGRHLTFVNVVGVSHAITPGFTLTAELWSSTDLDPDGTTQQYSMDFATSWQPEDEPNLQLDAGINIGLNSATPDLQAYMGVSRRF